MTGHVVLEPSADHPLEIAPTGKRVTVYVQGELIADTFQALTVREANYPKLQYIPFVDLANRLLLRSDKATYCPYKGNASHYSVATESGSVVRDAIWVYETPHPAAAMIAGHAAFYPDKAQIFIGGAVFGTPPRNVNANSVTELCAWE